jgi:hypothetical protein
MSGKCFPINALAAYQFRISSVSALAALSFSVSALAQAPASTQWVPNDDSTYTFEAFYQGYREEMFNNLHFTFADWWGSLGPNPESTFTL